MDTITIKSSLFDYSVEFISSAQAKLTEFGGNCVYVIDRNVYNLYKEMFSVINNSRIFVMDAVESNKNIYMVIELVDFLKGVGFKKDWKLIAFGGGITQDVSCFASNIYLRNIDWYFFPTTLLAMSDSCIGGKCGINHGEFKNQLGVFYPPRKVFIDTAFLNTLSYGDWLNGWGEILKFSLTDDPKFYEAMQKVDSFIPCVNIGKWIHRGLFTKKRIIEDDEFEGDLRRVLNYGHTFGHALEAYTNNEIPHGKGVIWGIDVVNYIAARENLITRDLYLRIKAFIKMHFLTEEIVVAEPEKLFSIISTDKKVRGNVIHLAVLDNPSHLITYPLNIGEKLNTYFKEYLNETHEYYSD